MKIMTLNRLETHDRLLEFNKQADYISQGCEDCIKNRPLAFGTRPFYIFCHARTDEDPSSKRLIWQPRLTKPKAQTNSMLFRWSYPDIIKIIWMIPSPEMWKQYENGKMTHSEIIMDSIYAFQHDRTSLEAPEEDDTPDHKVNAIYADVARNAI